MGLTDLLDLRYDGGDYADPKLLTDIGRVLQNYNSRGVANSALVKTSPGLLFGLTISSVSAQYIQAFDASAVPAENSVPLFVFTVAATSSLTLDWIPPRSFRNGLVFCTSSTQHTKTINPTPDAIFDVQYV